VRERERGGESDELLTGHSQNSSMLSFIIIKIWIKRKLNIIAISIKTIALIFMIT
jgi:hypothetical protein